jgi:hypothetical protein
MRNVLIATAVFAAVAMLVFSVDIAAKLAAKLVICLRDMRRESRKIEKEFNVNDD